MEISGIPKTTARGVKVISKKTGKSAWLPRAFLDFLPGHVVLPQWLAKKFKKGPKNPCLGMDRVEIVQNTANDEAGGNYATD